MMDKKYKSQTGEKIYNFGLKFYLLKKINSVSSILNKIFSPYDDIQGNLLIQTI